MLLIDAYCLVDRFRDFDPGYSPYFSGKSRRGFYMLFISYAHLYACLASGVICFQLFLAAQKLVMLGYAA